MKALTLFVVALFLAVTVADPQWPQNNGQQPFPNFPQAPTYNDICSRPGANCVSQVCDSKGNCKSSGASSVTGAYVMVLMASSALMGLLWRRF